MAIFFVAAILATSLMALAPRQASAATINAALTSTSTNASTTLAKVGDSIRFILTLTNGVPTSTPTIDINGSASTTMSGSAGVYTFSTTTTTNFTEGQPVPYVIWYGSNTANNSSSSIVAVTSGVDVRFDKTAPTVTASAVVSSNSSSTIAKPGDILTVYATSSQQLINATTSGTIAGNAVTFFCTAGSGWNQPEGCVASTTAPSTSGAVSFSFTPTDLAGNVGTAYTTPTGTSVYVYGAGPTISVTGTNPLSLYANNGTSYSDAGATAVDARSNTVSVTTSSNNVNQASAGSYTVSYSATDSAGNTTTASRTVTVTAPGGGGPIVGSFGSSGGGSLIPVLPGTTPISQTSAPGVNPSGATSTPVTVAQLQQQLATLVAQLAALTGGSTTFSRDLTVGSTGADVKALQQYLNRKGYEVAASGAGSAGEETTRFGPATKAALAKFQAAVKLSPASGYFGAKTRAYVNANQ